MRWEINNKKVGDERLVRRFPIFPRRIGDTIYWLEWITVRQVRQFDFDNGWYWEWREVF